MADRKLLVLVGIATFLIGACLKFPARVAYDWFAPNSLQLSGIDGSPWHGEAAAGTANDLYFTRLKWAFKPLALITGKLSFQISVDTSAGPISTSVGIGLGGTLSMSDLQGRLSLDALHPALHANRIDGILNIQLQSLVLQNGWPSEVNGRIDIGNLFAGALGSTPLGNFTAEFSTGDDGIVAEVEDAGAIFDVIGTIRLGDDRSYSLLGFVAENSKTPAAIKQNLRLLGSPDQNGQRQFRFEGEF